MSKLYKFYGREDVWTTGNPRYSFFTKSYPHRDSESLLPYAKNCNGTVRHSNFSIGSYVHNTTASKMVHELDLNLILREYDLLGGVHITYESDTIDELDHVELAVGDAVFRHSMDDLLMIGDMGHFNNVVRVKGGRKIIVSLPVGLFKDTLSWVKISTGIKVVLRLEFTRDIQPRVDLKVANIDSEEKRRHDILTNYNYGERDKITDLTVYHEKLTLPDFVNGKARLDLKSVKFGMKGILLSMPSTIPPVIKSATVHIKQGDKVTDVVYDTYQLVCMNKVMYREKMKLGDNWYFIPFSLNDDYHPSGDRFSIDMDEFYVEFELVDNVLEVTNMNSVNNNRVIVNQHRAVVYHVVDKQLKCEFMTLSGSSRLGNPVSLGESIHM